MGHLATDGTTIKANASTDYTLSEDEIRESGQVAVSLSDPEARFMENKKNRIELSYNPTRTQITVDHDSGIINRCQRCHTGLH